MHDLRVEVRCVTVVPCATWRVVERRATACIAVLGAAAAEAVELWVCPACAFSQPTPRSSLAAASWALLTSRVRPSRPGTGPW